MIFYLSSITPAQPLPFSFSGSDKVIHFFEYLGFSFLSIRALYPGEGISARTRYLAAFFLAVGYGALDEFHQLFVPGRECSGFDLLADAAGAAAGILAFERLTRFLRLPAVQE